MGNKQRKVEDTILDFLGLTREDFEEAKTWEDHDTAVEKAEKEVTIGEETEKITTIDLLDNAVSNILHKLNAGIIEFENGLEMLQTVEAVSQLETLKKGVND